jgi:hypothetical protein
MPQADAHLVLAAGMAFFAHRMIFHCGADRTLAGIEAMASLLSASTEATPTTTH